MHFKLQAIEFATPCVPFSKEDVALKMLGINVLLSEMSAINSFEFAKSNKGSNIEFSTFPSERNNSTRVQPVTPRRFSVARIRSDRSQIVHDIHQEHRQSQIDLDASIQMKARKQRRKTQLALLLT